MLKRMLNQFRLRQPFGLLIKNRKALVNRTRYRPPHRAHPRRMRCGLSLFEAMLVMLIAVPMVQQGVRLAESYIRQQAGVQESRLLTQVVTAASTFALRGGNAQQGDGLQDFIRDEIGVGRILRLPPRALADVDALLSTATHTSLRREIQVIFHARGSNELVVIARAVTPADDDTQPYVPHGGIGIGLVGYVPADAPSRLRGPGLNYNLTTLQDLAATQYGSRWPVVGDQLAIAILRIDQNVLPYLHRDTVDGHPEATQMQTNLDMRRNDIIGAGEVRANEVISNSIVADRLIVTESCTGCEQTPETEGRTTP